MRALVTGGAGFVGSHVVDALLARGDEVAVLDNLDSRVHGTPPARAPGARFVQGDVRSALDVREALGDRGVDVVFHEAAMVGYGRGAADAEAFTDANVVGTIRLLDALSRAPRKPERVVLASTMALYGEGAYECRACRVPREAAPRRAQDLERGAFEPRCGACGEPLEARAVTEEHPPRPATSYAISKLDQELTAMSLGRALGIPVVALRYHNVYGARMPRGTPYAGVASLFKSRLLAGEPPLVFEDGGQLRDFVHVADVARANLLAADAPLARVAFEAMNVGTGAPRPIRDLARALADAIAPGLAPRVTGDWRAGDVRHVYASVEKARKLLAYEPRVAFEAGVAAFAREPTREAPRSA